MPIRDDISAPDLSKALGMAAEIFSAARSSDAAPTSATDPAGPTQADPLPSNAELADRLAQMGLWQTADQSSAPPSADTSATPADEPAGIGSGFSLGSLAEILPPILQALSGNGDLIKPEKANLVRAFKPYLSETRSPEIDRAIRMANVARAAKKALSVLGR